MKFRPFVFRLIRLALVLCLIVPAIPAAHTQALEADLQLQLAAQPGAAPGGLVTLDFQAASLLPEAVSGAVVTVTLPEWTSFEPSGSDERCRLLEGAAEGSASAREVTCDLPDLPPAPPEGEPEAAAFQVKARLHPRLPPGRSLSFSASIASPLPDPNPADNTAQVTVTVNDDGSYPVFIAPAAWSVHPGEPRPGVIYVNARATGLNNGTSWKNAFTDLQSAISSASPAPGVPVQVWVAAGVYRPKGAGRASSFTLRSGVEIYGGFQGDEGRLEDRQEYEMNLASHTVLSGEVGGSGAEDNSFSVVSAVNVDSSAVLEGFTIRGGYAGGSDDPTRSVGGGIKMFRSSPALRRLVIERNHASAGGAGMYMEDSSPSLRDVTFIHNAAAGSQGKGGAVAMVNSSPVISSTSFRSNSASLGGAIYFGGGSTPTLINVEFIDNEADSGGAIYTLASNPTLTNATLAKNATRAETSGALHIQSGGLTLQNSIVWGNPGGAQVHGEGQAAPVLRYSIVEGLPDDPAGRLFGSADPNFADLEAGLLQIKPGSPAADQGSEAYLPAWVHHDLAGNPRSSGARTDLGAYEVLNNAPVMVPGEIRLGELVENAPPSSNPGAKLADLLVGRIWDEDPGTIPGVAAVDASDALGAWQISADGGATWQPVGPVSWASVLLVSVNDRTRIRFLPAADMNGLAVITLRAWDRSDRYPSMSRGVQVQDPGETLPYSADVLRLVQPVKGVNDARLGLDLAPRKFKPGAVVELVLQAANPEPESIPGAVIDIALPEGFLLVESGTAPGCSSPAPQAVTCRLGGLPSRGMVSFTVRLRVPGDAAIWWRPVFTASLKTDHIDPDLSNNRASVRGLVVRVNIQLPVVRK